MSGIPSRHPDLVYPSDYHTDDDDSNLFIICLVVSIVIAIVVIIVAVSVANNDHSQDTEDVVQDLDQYGGAVYLDEAIGRSSLELRVWYIPKESNVKLAGDYIYVDGAKSYSYETATHEIYLYRQSIGYIEINDH